MRDPGVPALSFDEISVGRRAEREVALPAGALDAFARLSGDVNPLHMDASFAVGRGYDGRLAHGLLVASYFSALIGTELPGRDCLLQQVRFDFKRPVRMGEKLTVSIEVIQKVEAVRALVLEARAVGPDGTLRVSGRIQVGFSV